MSGSFNLEKRMGGKQGLYGKKRAREKYMGKEFLLNCGITVTVIDYEDSYHITVQGPDGRSRVCRSGDLNNGEVDWFGRVKDYSTVEVGQEFKTFCGTNIKVLEYLSKGSILVEDAEGHKKMVSSNALKNGCVRWSEFRLTRTPRGAGIKVGGKFMLTCGEEVTVTALSVGGTKRATIEDSFGNSKMAAASAVVSGFVSWPWREGKLAGKGHYVYFVVYEAEVVYIGKGRDSRYLHPNSGTSSSYGLNKLHFEGKSVEVFLHRDNMSDSEALQEEKLQIALHKPRFNNLGRKAAGVSVKIPTLLNLDNFSLTACSLSSKVTTSTQQLLSRTTNLAGFPAHYLKRNYHHERSNTLAVGCNRTRKSPVGYAGSKSEGHCQERSTYQQSSHAVC